MVMRRVLSALFLCCFVSTSASQNLLKNGDFEDSSSSFSPWTLTNPNTAKEPGIDARARVGLADNRAFRVTTVSNNPTGLMQEVTTGSGTFQLGVHLFSSWPTRVRIRVWTGNTKNMEHLLFAVAGPQMLISHGFPLAAEKHRIEIMMLGTHNHDVKVHVDDVFFQETPKVPLQVVELTPSDILIRAFRVNEPVALFASMHRVAQPFRVPGWNGLVALDPLREGGVILLRARVGLSEAVPKRLLYALDRVVHIQGLGLTSRTFGKAVSFRIRRP